MASWRPANQICIHCIDWVGRALSKLSFENPDSFPDFSGSRRLCLFSDYAGTAKSGYRLYSFLLTSESALTEFDREIAEWRSSKRLDNRRFEYKKLKDSKKSTHLHTFLAQLNRVPGLLLTIAIDARIESVVCGDKIDRSSYPAQLPISDCLSDAVVEKIVRCASFAAIVVNGLCAGAQDVVWISDDDDMFANDRIATGAGGLIDALFNYFTSVQMGTLEYGVASKFEAHRGATDLLSACDLTCGYFVSHFREAMGPIVRVPRRKDAILSAWLSSHGKLLRKVCFTIDKQANGGPSLSRSVLTNPFKSTIPLVVGPKSSRPF